MNQDRDAQVQQLFRDCLGLGQAERDAFLRERCSANDELQREVESLLDHHESDDGVLDRPPDFSRLGVPTPPGGFQADPSGGLRVGATLGPYHILESLGHGGMGTVYLAEQTRPVRRRVALKVLRNVDSRDIQARFEAERQALALMDHPNIARIFDADSTPDGRPYFTMEYVPGVPLAEYCDHHRLTVEERLDIFRQICDGVQHAHQKAILHRDLKPSNIIVTVRGGQPVPKIIDFGVAKALHDQKLTDSTLHTLHGYLVGTPDYMSPEQAATGGSDIDTRSDIYSLGALLYELLTGTVPLDVRGAGSGGPAEIQRRIVSEEPEPPSRRVARQTDAAVDRSTTPSGLVRALRGELDWVTQRALEKDRTRRYPTVSEMSADILRFLRGEPVHAGPPGVRYRFAKFASRHRLALVAGLSVLLVLSASTVVSTIFAVRAEEARQAAERSRQFAEAQRATAEAERSKYRSMTEFWTQVVEMGIAESGGSRELLLSHAIDRAWRSMGQLPLEARVPIGVEMAEFSYSTHHFGTAREIMAETLVAARERSELDRRSHGRAACVMAMTNYELALRADATERARLAASGLELIDEAIDVLERESPDQFDLPAAYDTAARLSALTGETDRALDIYRDATARFAGAEGPLGHNLTILWRGRGELHADLARRLRGPRQVAAARGHWDEAGLAFRRALELLERQEQDRGFDKSKVLWCLAEAAAASEDFAAVESHASRARRLLAELDQAQSFEWVMASRYLGLALLRRERPHESRAVLQELEQHLVQRDPPVPYWSIETSVRLSEAERGLDQTDRALRHALRALEVARDHYGDRFHPQVVQAQLAVAESHAARGEVRQAEAIGMEAAETARAEARGTQVSLDAARWTARLLMDQSRFEEAEAWAKEAFATAELLWRPDDPRTRELGEWNLQVQGALENRDQAGQWRRRLSGDAAPQLDLPDILPPLAGQG